MNKMKLSKLIFAILFLNSIFAFSQQIQVSGTVTDEVGMSIPGVSVVVEGTKVGTLTDLDGKYSLNTETGKRLQFSYVGMKTTTKVVEGKLLDVQMVPDVMGLDEVVVTGSTLNAKKRQLGNSFTSLKGDELNKSGSGNALVALQGRVAGARVTQVSGDPAGGLNISLRGINSITGGSDPLYVIDGVIVSNSAVAVTQTGNNVGESQAGTPRLADINPNDIESLNVINGAAAAAIYGSRAANGVVLITTKRGVSGKTKITVGTSANFNQLRKKVSISTYGKQFGYEALRLGTIVNVAPGTLIPGTLTPVTTTPIVFDGATFNLATNLVDVTRYDYQDLIFQNGIGLENYINVAGGNEKTKYFASISNMKNEGIIKNTDFSRLGLRLNLDQQLTSWANLSVGLSALRSKSSDLPSGNVFYSPINSVNITNNIWDATRRDAAGNLMAVEPTRVNPLSIIETFKLNQIVNRAIGNVKLSITPLAGMKIELVSGLDTFSQLGSQYIPVFPYAGVNPAYYSNGYASTANNISFLYNTDLNVTYNRDFGDFSSNTAVGYNYQNSRIDYTVSSGENLAPGIVTVNGSPNRLTSYSLAQQWIDGYFGQETIGFKNQVFLTGAVRVDNSSIFSKSQRNQLYTKASMSWVVSELDIWKNSSINDIWSSAKLRASFGEAGGVTAIGAYDRFNLISGNNYLGINTYTPNYQLASENVAPERTRELEFGADLGFLDSKINLGLTFYSQKVFDLLVNRQIASSEGGTSRLDNVGEMENKGFELSLNAGILKTDNLDWSIYGIYSTNKNKITKLGSPTVAINNVAGAPIFLIEGEPASVFYGTYFNRDANGETTKDAYGLEQTAKSGTTALRKIIGNPNPDFTMSFGSNLTYKKISFGFLLDGVYGADVFNADRRTRQGVGIGDFSEKELKGELPRGYVKSIYPIEEWRIEDGSFTKLREVSLGYTLPDNILKGLTDFTITLVGRNLYSFDSYDGFDPETNAGGVSDRLRGIDFGNVPIPRTYQLSLKGSF